MLGRASNTWALMLGPRKKRGKQNLGINMSMIVGK
jgi:hypothetical protein